ncbi:MAG: hypothetical protein P8181_08790 [bacterium]
MNEKNRRERESELRLLLRDPIERLVLERKFFEVTKSIAPQSDVGFLEAILEHEFDIWDSNPVE